MVASFIPIQSIVSASATEGSYAGGIAGNASNSNINQSINSNSNINNSNNNTGGIVGNASSSNINQATNSNSNINNSSNNMSGFPDSGSDSNLSDSIENENVVVTYTYDEATNTYSVCDEDGLNAWNTAAQSDPTTNLVLTADITLTLAEGTTSNWTPVGNDTTPYTGTVDGAGHTITGLTIDSSTDYTAFIGCVNSGVRIKNLTLKDISIKTTGKYTAGFVGHVKDNNSSDNVLIEFCSVDGGSISSTSYGVGGIIGYADGYFTIVACSNTADIACLAGAGGIVGCIRYSGGMVYGCYNAGTITKTSSSWDCGGIAGYAQYGKIHGCYNTGETNEDYAIVGDNRCSGTYYNKSNYWSSSHSYANGSAYQREYFNDGATKITSNSQWANAASVMNSTLASLGYSYEYILNTNEDTKSTEPLLLCINHPQWENGVCQNCGLECFHNTVVPATCTAQAYCSECGFPQGDVNPDNHTGTLSYADLKDNTHILKWDCCGATENEAVAHNFTYTTQDNTISAHCVDCNKDETFTFALSETTCYYDGKVKTPDVEVKNSNGDTLVKDVDYTVSYASGRKNPGTYNVTVTLKGTYSAQITLSFKITTTDISDCTVKLSCTNYTYNGKAKTPTVSVKNTSGTTLTNGTHYTVTYASGRTKVGTYKVIVTMKGYYTGTKTLTFKINPINIDTCTISLSKTSYTYNAKVQTPTVTVKNSGGTKLTKDTHYTVSYSSGRKNAGTYNVTVTMKGHYSGTKTLSYKIKPIDISTCTLKLSTTSYTYNSKVRTPGVTVKNAGGTALTKDTHYTVTYAEGRVNAGTYKVTVTLKGNYTGSKTLSFKINPVNIDTCTVKLSSTSYTYNGREKTPGVTVTNVGGTALTKDKHYTVTYADGRVNAGTYKVTVALKGNYTGSKTLSFKINPINISNCTVALSTTSYTYNGKVQTPSVTVKSPTDTTLTKDTHYTVSYASGRKNAGTYNVTVTMKGNYTGTKTLSYKINPIDISTCTAKLSTTSYTYNSKARTPGVTVMNAGGTTLTKDTHYTVSYASGRINAGTYKVTVTMKGNYKGTKTLSFKINPIDISKLTLSLNKTKYIYDGAVKKPYPTVKTANGATLTNGTHFTYAYATNRKSVGAHTVTVTMKGNYTGTKTLSYTIVPASTTIYSLTAGTKSIGVKINNKVKSISGYEVTYSTAKDFSGRKTITATVTTAELEKATKTVKLSELTTGKTYYVKVRTYKTVNGVNYYSGWSACKYVKAK